MNLKLKWTKPKGCTEFKRSLTLDFISCVQPGFTILGICIVYPRAIQAKLCLDNGQTCFKFMQPMPIDDHL